MSSNITVQRICQHCGSEFTARTTVTRFCGKVCAKAAYKKRMRESRLAQVPDEFAGPAAQALQPGQTTPAPASNEILTIAQVAAMVGCCNKTIYNLIKNGTLKASRFGLRKIVIRRSELDRLLSMSEIAPADTPAEPRAPKPKQQPAEGWYTTRQIQQLYDISENALYTLINANKIPRKFVGADLLISKADIDSLLG